MCVRGVCVCAVPQNAQRYRLTQPDRCIGIAAPVNTGMDAVTKADIVRQLMQFAIDGDLSSITARVIVQRRSITRRHLRVWNDKIAVERTLGR